MLTQDYGGGGFPALHYPFDYSSQSERMEKVMTKKINPAIPKWPLVAAASISIALSGLLLVFSPDVAAFGGATAGCKDGSTVSCSGYKCTATENVGCSCSDSSGKVVDKHSCSGGDDDDGFAMLEEVAY